METIKQILKWHQDARPNPTEDDAKVQIGCHYEEVVEMMEATTDTFDSRQLGVLSDVYKESCTPLMVNRIELLDALCDQIVTAVGVAHCLGMDIEGALAEVARSNDSKRQPDGSFLRDENGKIMKGERYSPPDLSNYL